MKSVNVVAAIIKKDNKILIAERGYGEFKGMYEFPGGKVEKDENPSDALWPGPMIKCRIYNLFLI